MNESQQKEQRRKLFDLLPKVLSYGLREYKLPTNEEESFHFDLYAWVSMQPDSKVLMMIFPLMDFDMLRFLNMILRCRPRGGGEPASVTPLSLAA